MTPRWLLLILLIITSSDVFLFAAPDDFEEMPNPAANIAGRVAVMNINIDQQLFNQYRNEAGARTHFSNMLKLQLSEIVSLCQPTEEQQQKLMLAAQGDVHRFFTATEALRQKYEGIKNDQNAWNNVWQELHPLQLKLSGGLFDEQSLFAKTVQSVLTPEQASKYQVVMDERRAFRNKAKCECAVVFGQSIPLRSDQSDRLLKLVMKEFSTQSNMNNTNQVYMGIYRIPQAKLRVILDDFQWKLVEPILRQFNPQPMMNIFQFIPR
jgi:hypothetical protein